VWLNIPDQLKFDRWPDDRCLLKAVNNLLFQILIPIGFVTGKSKKLLIKKDIVVTFNEKEIIIPTIKLDKDHRVEIGGTLTTHKIQGKTFSGVVLDLNDRVSASMMPYITFNSLLVMLSRVTDGKNMKILPLKNGVKSLQYLKGIEIPLELYIWRAGYSEQGSTWNEFLSKQMFDKIKSVQEVKNSKPVKTNSSFNNTSSFINRKAAATSNPDSKITKKNTAKKFKLSSSNTFGSFFSRPPLLSQQQLEFTLLDSNQVYGLKWDRNSCSLDSMYQCLFHLYGAINFDTRAKWDNLYPPLTSTFKAIAKDCTMWGALKPRIIELGYNFRNDIPFGDCVSNMHTHNNFFCITMDNLLSQRFGESKNHLLYMDQKLLSDCHPITTEQAATSLGEKVENIFKFCCLHSINAEGDFVRTFANIQETIDSKYLHKDYWLPITQSCQYCLHMLENNITEMRAKNYYNSNVTYFQDIFVIELTPHSSHCTADLKRNIDFIQDEISLFHVDTNGIHYVDDGNRRSTHRLHSIIYFSSDFNHFIARFRKGEDVYEYDGMKNPDANCNNRVKCIKLPAKSADFNPFSYFITPITTPTKTNLIDSYWASFIYYVKIDILV
jgi:hypothetical protein